MKKSRVWTGLLLLLLLLIAAAGHAEEERPAPPVFSREAGFYDELFYLELFSPDGAEIWYTLDSTDPAISRTAVCYTRPIEIANNNSDINRASSVMGISLNGSSLPKGPVEKGQVVRAVCRDAEGRVSDEAVNTYFIKKRKPYYTQMTVISMVIDHEALFDKETGIYVIGNQYYRWKDSDDFVLYDDPSNSANITNYNSSGREWERPCSIQVFEQGKAVFSQAVGVRLSGNWSRAAVQKSFKFFARKEYGDGKMRYAFFGDDCTDMNGESIVKFDKIVLRNGGNDNGGVHFRDDLNQQLMSGLNVSVQAKKECILFINGEYWGMYTLQETPDDHYLSAHYGIKESNITVIKNGEWEGDEAVYQSYRDLYDAVQTMDLTDADHYAFVCENIDINGFIDYMAAESYINNWDFAPNINNWMIWRANEPVEGNPYADGRWRFVVYDTEFSLGLYGSDSTRYSVDYFSAMDLSADALGLPALFVRLLQNDTFRAAFHDRYLELVDTIFDPAHVMPLIDAYVSREREAFIDTMSRFNMWNNFDNDVERVRDFFRRRAEYALYHLEKVCASGVTEEAKSSEWHSWTGDCMGSGYELPDGSLRVETLKKGSEDWQNQLWMTMPLEKGKTYTVSFSISCDHTRVITFCVQRDGGDYENYFVKWPVAAPEAAAYEYTFTMKKDCESAKLAFFCGSAEGTYTITDFTVKVE